MLTFVVVLILFATVDSFLMNLEKRYTLEELTEMGICLDNSLMTETR